MFRQNFLCSTFCLLVPGNHAEEKSQTGFLPCIPGHPHPHCQHCGKGAALGVTKLPGWEVSDWYRGWFTGDRELFHDLLVLLCSSSFIFYSLWPLEVSRVSAATERPGTKHTFKGQERNTFWLYWKPQLTECCNYTTPLMSHTHHRAHPQ